MVPIFMISCSPHPGAGKWKAVDKNDLGIEKLSILYEGKSEFITKAEKVIIWHCFWGAKDKEAMSMTCTPSNNTNKHEPFEFILTSENKGKFSRQGKTIGLFQRQAYDIE